MAEKFGFYNIFTGETIICESLTEVSQRLGEIVLAKVIEYSHNRPVIKIEVDEAGNQTFLGGDQDNIPQEVLKSMLFDDHETLTKTIQEALKARFPRIAIDKVG